MDRQDGRFWTGMAAHGDRPALILRGGDVVSYAGLADHAADFAGRLGGKRQLVAISAAASLPAIAGYLGALAGGHVAAMLPAGDLAALESFEDRFRPDAVWREVSGRWRLELRNDGRPRRRASEPPEDSDLHPDLALLLMTSGSTGCGKAVRLSHAALAANAASIARYLDLRADDRTGLLLPLHYSYGLSVLASHLAVGASIDLTLPSAAAPDFAERFADSGATNLAGVPHTFELLERGFFRADLPPQLRFMTVAGGRLAPRLVEAYARDLEGRGGRFFAMYGQTEATARIAYLPPERALDAPDRIGIAIPGGSLSLIDADGAPVKRSDVEGELVYHGPNVMMGYAMDRADLQRGHEVGALATGDLAVRDSDGLYRIVGRKARFSKIAGIRVGHDAVEAALARAGFEVAVTGGDSGLKVAAVRRGDASRLQRELLGAVTQASGLTARHVEIAIVAELPRLASGKIDLPAVGRLFDRAKPPVGDGIATVFRDAFFPQKVADGDSFVSLSGDSLRFVEVSAALEQRLGQLPAGWERMSIGELRRLERQEGDGARQIGSDLAIRAAAILLVVMQHATLWPIPGGSAAMMVLIGFGLARFQREALADYNWRRILRPLLSVLGPYYLILGGYALVWNEVPWASVFLAGNFGFADPVNHDMLPYLYWFVEAYAQTLAVLLALFALPAVRRLVRRDAFRLGLLMLGGALILRLAGPQLWPLGGRDIFTLAWVLHLAAFGWCAALADSRAQRLIVLAAALVVMPVVAILGGNWVGSWVKFGLQIGVIATLLYMPRLRLPAWLAGPVLAIAAGSFHIYLTHRLVPEVLIAPLEGHMPHGVFTAVAVVGGVALGLLAYSLERGFRARLAAGRATESAAATMSVR